MRERIPFSFLLLCLLILTACATGTRETPPTIYGEAVVFEGDDGFLQIVGTTADNARALVSLFFSFEIKFDSGMNDLDKRIDAQIAINNLAIAFNYYITFILIPSFTREEFINEVRNENSTLLFDGITEFIRDNEDLVNVRLTSAHLELVAL